ncbi:ABC transporter ATP-binding protein [Candidatus Saccharibacteria bacterium]|nr:ABC transporter ATP-binding protein [Candidatus Saccharibacteria bacterium]
MFRIFRNFTKRDCLFLIGGVLLVASQVGLELKMPDFMSEITRLVETPGSDIRDILLNGGLMLLCALGAFFATIFAGYCFARASASLSMNVRKKLFDKVEELDMHEVKKFSTSSLITRTTNDITQIQMFVAMGAQMLVRAPLTAIWAITKIAGKSWQWSTVTAIAVVVLLSVMISVLSVVIPRFKIVQKLTDRINGVTREHLTGIRVVRAFNAERYQEQKFDKVNHDLTSTHLFNERMLSLLSPAMYLVMNGVTLAIYVTGAYIIANAAMPDRLGIFSDMVVFSSYAIHVIFSFLMVTMVLMLMPRAQVSAGRINEVMKEKITIKDGNFDDETAEKGTVEFRNVSFKYPDAEEYLLRGISFRAEKGETVAFVGSTGSGKTTLVNLIPRFYDATSGEVFVDGVNVRDFKQEALHNRIAYVPQKAVMFDGSVSYNVAYGDNGREKTSDTAVKKAIKTAQAQHFVEKMPDSYDAHIAQGGTNISGGQKQRLAIARAIARDPEIYIFDDSFSALDFKTDAALRHELKKQTGDATNLIVAQRIGTIMHADKILVLDEGKCVGMGTHQELMKNCPVYQQIALSQLTEKELNV